MVISENSWSPSRLAKALYRLGKILQEPLKEKRQEKTSGKAVETEARGPSQLRRTHFFIARHVHRKRLATFCFKGRFYDVFLSFI